MQDKYKGYNINIHNNIKDKYKYTLKKFASINSIKNIL